jgi:HSP20 family protein
MAPDDEQVFDDVEHVQKRMDHLFHTMMPTLHWLTVRQQKTWRPSTDVYETDDSLIVKVEIAGMSEDDFSISLSNRNLSISGVRADTACKLAYQQLEIPYGHFRTEVFLPYAVELGDIKATYKDGLLTVVLPKARVHQVKVVEKTAHSDKIHQGD